MKTETFKINKQIRNNATKVLVNAGWSVRKAIGELKISTPYLFASNRQIIEVENSFSNF